jgi:V/A-type H+-transporting ATPase subunit D
VNLFEKVKIPECLDNIRRIKIYLGDQQANAVGISKVAKKKIEVRELEVVLV